MKVGFVGLGTMGSRMAANVARANFDLMVFDLKLEPGQRLGELGARVAGSAAEVARHAEIVHLALATDAQVEAAVLGTDGVLSGAPRGSILVFHSTVHPGTIAKILDRAAPQGVELVEAQMTGGPHGAESGDLVFMVGGDEAAVERCRPLLSVLGKQTFHMGALGMGTATKLAQQVITTVTMLAVSEGFGLAENAGVDMDRFEEFLRETGTRSHISDVWRERFAHLNPSYIEGFFQGLTPALTLGHDLGIALPATALAQQRMRTTFGAV
ncbi:MAG: oxidoreductase protein [Chloroflexi bacterium]|nr:oxidoreductase protein [Chloroflexota bacterium]